MQALPVEEQVCSIYAGVKGYLDTIKVEDVTRFEQALLRNLRSSSTKSSKPSVKTTDQPETEEKLKAFMERSVRGFA